MEKFVSKLDFDVVFGFYQFFSFFKILIFLIFTNFGINFNIFNFLLLVLGFNWGTTVIWFKAKHYFRGYVDVGYEGNVGLGVCLQDVCYDESLQGKFICDAFTAAVATMVRVPPKGFRVVK